MYFFMVIKAHYSSLQCHMIFQVTQAHPGYWNQRFCGSLAFDGVI